MREHRLGRFHRELYTGELRYAADPDQCHAILYCDNLQRHSEVHLRHRIYGNCEGLDLRRDGRLERYGDELLTCQLRNADKRH